MWKINITYYFIFIKVKSISWDFYFCFVFLLYKRKVIITYYSIVASIRIYFMFNLVIGICYNDDLGLVKWRCYLKNKAYVLLSLAGILWGFQPVVVKFIVAEIEPTYFSIFPIFIT